MNDRFEYQYKLTRMIEDAERSGCRIKCIKLTNSEIYLVTGKTWSQLQVLNYIPHFKGIPIFER